MGCEGVEHIAALADDIRTVQLFQNIVERVAALRCSIGRSFWRRLGVALGYGLGRGLPIGQSCDGYQHTEYEGSKTVHYCSPCRAPLSGVSGLISRGAMLSFSPPSDGASNASGYVRASASR